MLLVPVMAIVPLHAPEAVHEVALLADQLKVEFDPLVMLLGLALKETVGAAVAGAVVVVTVTDFAVLPPEPEQVRVYCVVVFSAAVDMVPLIDCAPLQPPEAMHEVALLELHVSVALLPLEI